MENFCIMSDSSSDIPLELRNKYNIDLVPLLISFDKENYLQEHVDINVDDFYKTLRKGNIFPKTSLASLDSYMSKFKTYLEKGQDVLFFTLCSDLSGSFQAAKNSYEMIKDEYPDNKVIVVDNRTNSFAGGILVLEACKMKEAGYSIDKTFARLEEIKLDACFIFTANDLKYLQKGGRLGKASALFGTLLNIKPIIYLKDGLLEPHSKVRGRKKCLTELVNTFAEFIKGDTENYSIGLCHSDCLDEALEVKAMLKDKYNLEVSYPLSTLGASVGSHMGPDAIGISFVRKFNK